MESLQQVLSRLAIEHLNRETLQYIQKLEAVANSAKLVVSGESEAIDQLKTDLANLERPAA